MALRRSLTLGLGVLSLWPLLPAASRAPLYGRLLFELVRDARVPWSSKALLGLAVAYIAAPVDIIPDSVPLVGGMDDLVVAVIAIDLFLDSVPRALVMEKMYSLGIDGRELERDLESIRRLIPLPLLLAARRLPQVLDRGAAALRRELGIRWARRPDCPVRVSVPWRKHRSQPKEEFSA